MTLTPGATVKLKSGGPFMTISWIDGDEAMCAWFAGSDVKSQRFPLTSLVQATPA